MKKAMAIFVAVALLGALAWAAESTAKKGEDVSMSGMLSCASCKIAGHTCPKGCCQSCVKAGDPALLEDEKSGELFLMLSGDMGKSAMTPERMDMLGGKVTVKGILVKEKGLQGIYVKSMEKMAEKK